MPVHSRSLTISNRDIRQLREQQQVNLHSLLCSLQANLVKNYATTMKLEYAYLEFSDDTYHDIRKEKQYSSK